MGLRVEKEVELAGLDSSEHGLISSYADFMPSAAAGVQFGGSVVSERSSESKVPMNEAIPVQLITNENVPTSTNKPLISKIAIICNQAKFEDLKEMLNQIGVTGITVTQVLGCGIQKGNTKFYRGVPIDMILLPKIQVEVVICKIPVRSVIEAVKKTLYTGNIGDGKIFVYDVVNVVKVRTGEEGYDALQGSPEDELV
jgi:Amt family ammonium transporter